MSVEPAIRWLDISGWYSIGKFADNGLSIKFFFLILSALDAVLAFGLRSFIVVASRMSSKSLNRIQHCQCATDFDFFRSFCCTFFSLSLFPVCLWNGWTTHGYLWCGIACRACAQNKRSYIDLKQVENRSLCPSLGSRISKRININWIYLLSDFICASLWLCRKTRSSKIHFPQLRLPNDERCSRSVSSLCLGRIDCA